MTTATDRAVILNTEWGEAPTENVQPDTAGTVFDVNNPQGSAWGHLATTQRQGNKFGGSAWKLFGPWHGHEVFRKPPQDFIRGTANRMPYLGNRSDGQGLCRSLETFSDIARKQIAVPSSGIREAETGNFLGKFLALWKLSYGSGAMNS